MNTVFVFVPNISVLSWAWSIDGKFTIESFMKCHSLFIGCAHKTF
jgi:hypothetical protein